MALKKSAKLLATLIHKLDALIFNRKKFPITISIKKTTGIDGKEGGLACYLWTQIVFNDGSSRIADEAYYIYDSELKDLEEDFAMLSVAIHEIRHRAQEHRLKISFSLWQKIRKIIFYKDFRSWFLLKKAFWLSWKLRENPKEADAYFTYFLLCHKSYNLKDLIQIIIF